MYQKKFQCLHDADRHTQGNFNSEKASVIRVRLNKCLDKPYCKSEEEIVEFFKGKYLLLYVEEVRFKSSFFGEDSIVREGRLEWLRIGTLSQLEYPFYITKTKVQLQDTYFNLDQLTELENSELFKLV